MDLADIVARPPRPTPWAPGDGIPWSDPGFSERMLAEHLSQDHDAATRREETVDRHLAWVHERVLGGQPSRVLDLACGPGRYTCGLAARGHDCVGVDISPAAVAHARATAEAVGLAARHLEADIVTADPGTGFDLALVVFGQLHAFPPVDAARILANAFAALGPGGRLLLEVHHEGFLRDRGTRAPSWSTAATDLFSADPHLVLLESFWDEALGVASRRFMVVDAATAAVNFIVEHLQAYDDPTLDALLTEAGFADLERHPSLTGDDLGPDDGLFVVLATRPD